MKISDFNLDSEDESHLFWGFDFNHDVEKNMIKLENDIEKDMFQQFNKNREI